MNFKIFLIIMGFLNPQEQESFDHYASGMRGKYAEVGAKVVDKYPVAMSILGEEKPDFIMVVEFPDEQALQQLFGSEDYKELVPYREKAFEKLNVFISKK